MEEQTTIVRELKDKPNSYEFGKPSSRWKLYFNDAAELKKLIDDLNAQGISCAPEEA